MVRKRDIWHTCAKNGSLHVVPIKDKDIFFDWHLKECQECFLVKNEVKTLQDFIPNSELQHFNYKYRKSRI